MHSMDSSIVKDGDDAGKDIDRFVFLTVSVALLLIQVITPKLLKQDS